MENQLTPGQSNLQQSNNNLQQNNSTLQTGGSPTTSSSTSGVLSQTYNGDLKVQSAETVQTNTPQTYLPKDSTYGWLFFPLLVGAILVSLYLWSRLMKTEVLNLPEAIEPGPTPAITKPKKQKYQKKTTRKQRSKK